MHKSYLHALALAGSVGFLAFASATQAYAATGWVQNGSSWVYYDTDGSVHKGWIQTTDGYYYQDLSTGLMTIGWKAINNKWYYFKPSGLMAANQWVQDNGKWYYVLEDGTMRVGWIKIGADYYYPVSYTHLYFQLLSLF